MKTATPTALEARLAAVVARQQEITATIRERLDPPDIVEERAELEIEKRDLLATLARPAYDAARKKLTDAQALRAKMTHGLDRALVDLASSVAAVFDAAVTEYDAALAARRVASGTALERHNDSVPYFSDPRSERAEEFVFQLLTVRIGELAAEIGRSMKRGKR